MPKYFNPNTHDVGINLGNPTRRNITVVPSTPKPVPQGSHRYIEVPAPKAAEFVRIGMLALCPDQKVVATFDYAAEVAKVEARQQGRIVQRGPTAEDKKRSEDAKAVERQRALAAEKAEAARVAHLDEVRGRIRTALVAGTPPAKVVEGVIAEKALDEKAAADLVAEVQGQVEDAASQTPPPAAKDDKGKPKGR